MRLRDKVAIISGGANGMGEAEARLFAREGATVVIADVIPRGEAVAADINAGQGNAGQGNAGRENKGQGNERRGNESRGGARFVRTDVTSEDDWRAVIAETMRAYGRLDILVNNAGISGSAVGDHDDIAGWKRLLDINATGVFLGTKLAAAEMVKAGRGSIVNISSIMGFVGGAEGHPGYAASKGAVRLYTKAAACRYGPHGVRVNSVHPGYMPPMLNGTNGGMRASKIDATPLRRLGEPIEVAYGVLFLASDEASFVTGTELVIDGGYIAQ